MDEDEIREIAALTGIGCPTTEGTIECGVEEGRDMTFVLESFANEVERRVRGPLEDEIGALMSTVASLQAELRESRTNDRIAMSYLEELRTAIAPGATFPELVEAAKELTQ